MEKAQAPAVSKVVNQDGLVYNKRVLQGEREKTHDLYELLPEKCKVNTSYRFFEPKIQLVSHGHYFHSIDRKGKPSNVSSKDTGHFHYMEIVTNKNGEMAVKCGPPMRHVTKRVRGKDRTVEEPVFYGEKEFNAAKESANSNDSYRKAVVDEHTHEIDYKHSEVVKF